MSSEELLECGDVSMEHGVTSRATAINYNSLEPIK